MTDDVFFSRLERLAIVGSTNDVVRGWLDLGTREVCLALADEQTAGRGREGRAWIAPRGAAFLCSIGFRPTWLTPEHAWRLSAVAALAMADAAEEVAGLKDRTIQLKWPNDLVVEVAPGDVRKIAGVLGESVGLGGDDPRVVVGIGLNADWHAADFPPELAPTMTSLREASGGRPIDREALLEAFATRLEVRTIALRGGRFDVADWTDRQITTGRLVRLAAPDGDSSLVRAVGVDPSAGGLVVTAVTDDERGGGAAERTILSGEIVHLRLAEARPAGGGAAARAHDDAGAPDARGSTAVGVASRGRV